ncbi:MAG: ABC-F family ATP-binding cassette domain-containing protein [Hungatella sp.]|jgi:ATP-binding cassette subfamily F protein 3|nr:ABC-F family ATP-binding cassette domain-containing protein [Hungatella sp.]
MLYQIKDGTVSLGGIQVLSHIDFEIKGREKIGVVGINGAGKTTLLRLLGGELELDQDDRRQGPGIFQSRKLTVGMLGQQAFSDSSKTVEEELWEACPVKDPYDMERFSYEKEYDRLFAGFGFEHKEKKKRISEFSGGEQTKIALIRLLLEKPDVLLLDEPTNHLDMETVEWLETYLKQYDHAVVMVSHDRFFLDQVAEVVYELSDRKLVRYPGNYTHYRQEKLKNIRLQQKAYDRQQEEIRRLEALVERFKHKPRKAGFARSKKKVVERMERVQKPRKDQAHIFTGEISPGIQGSKWVLSAKELKVGYDSPLFEITMRIKKGQKIGVLGPNGAGKTTFLKTVAGLKEALSGTISLGNQITMGYFDQNSAEISSDETVAEHFHQRFPSLTDKEVRTILGHYLFGGRQAAKQVKDLSGGEKARLVLAELLQSCPNFLVLDEPTNHMDIHAKETLESAFQAYTGTILFVSHDRYFVRQVADAVMILEGDAVMYYPFGYEHYLERKRRQEKGESPRAQVRAEEQALIAGIRAVPRAERHRLREIPEEEAYQDWKLRLAAEAMDTARERVELISGKLDEMIQGWQESEGFWNGETWREKDKYAELMELRRQAWEEWHERCMEWDLAGAGTITRGGENGENRTCLDVC